jgi:hypothetical protein
VADFIERRLMQIPVRGLTFSVLPGPEHPRPCRVGTVPFADGVYTRVVVAGEAADTVVHLKGEHYPRKAAIEACALAGGLR